MDLNKFGILIGPIGYTNEELMIDFCYFIYKVKALKIKVLFHNYYTLYTQNP
jgi:hypothetical protein